jgi:glucose 1-dehydrogenase
MATPNGGGQEATCDAVLVEPGTPHSAALGKVAVQVPAAGEIQLRILEVGVCGTDAEIDQGLYGEAPRGEARLVLGHESLGQVTQVGAGVTAFRAGDLAVPIVRRPCPERCAPCAAGRWDMCRSGHYSEHGIARQHGFMRTLATVPADAAVAVPTSLRGVAVLTEPLTIVEKAVMEAYEIQGRLPWQPARALVTGAGPVGLLAALVLRIRDLDVYVLDREPETSLKARLVERSGARYVKTDADGLAKVAPAGGFDIAVEATGYAPLLFACLDVLAADGILVLTGVSGGHRQIEVDASAVNKQAVLENQVIVGSVNAARAHYEQAVHDLGVFEARFPGLAAALITQRHPLAAFRAAMDKGEDDVKSVVEVAGA